MQFDYTGFKRVYKCLQPFNFEMRKTIPREKRELVIDYLLRPNSVILKEKEEREIVLLGRVAEDGVFETSPKFNLAETVEGLTLLLAETENVVISKLDDFSKQFDPVDIEIGRIAGVIKAFHKVKLLYADLVRTYPR